MRLSRSAIHEMFQKEPFERFFTFRRAFRRCLFEGIKVSKVAERKLLFHVWLQQFHRDFARRRGHGVGGKGAQIYHLHKTESCFLSLLHSRKTLKRKIHPSD